MYSFLVLAFLSMCDGTSIIYQHKDIATKSKIELSPLRISCSPNDIVILATPVVNCKDVLYHLHRPNGDVIELDFTGPTSKTFNFHDTMSTDEDYPGNVVLKYINKHIKTMHPKRRYKIITVDQSDDKRDNTVDVEERNMNENDFMIGPLLEEDHGNWVLSIYCKDIDGEWIEMFQVITITLISTIPMEYTDVVVREGDTAELSFKYPIKDLETCELTAPPGLADRYFDRSQIELEKCGYVITNVSRHDNGVWKVTGVGRIVYKGRVTLHVIDSNNSFIDKNKSY